MSGQSNGNKFISYIHIYVSVQFLANYLRKCDYLPSMEVKLPSLEDEEGDFGSSVPQISLLMYQKRF